MTDIRFTAGVRITHVRGYQGITTRPCYEHSTVYVRWGDDDHETKEHPECIQGKGTQVQAGDKDAWEKAGARR